MMEIPNERLIELLLIGFDRSTDFENLVDMLVNWHVQMNFVGNYDTKAIDQETVHSIIDRMVVKTRIIPLENYRRIVVEETEKYLNFKSKVLTDEGKYILEFVKTYNEMPDEEFEEVLDKIVKIINKRNKMED